MNLPSFETYGNYKSGNYGAHALVFSFGPCRIYFSYKTPIAFYTPEHNLVCRENDWGPTTGKHLNAIQPDKSKRIPGDLFEQQLNSAFGALCPGRSGTGPLDNSLKLC